MILVAELETPVSLASSRSLEQRHVHDEAKNAAAKAAKEAKKAEKQRAHEAQNAKVAADAEAKKAAARMFASKGPTA